MIAFSSNCGHFFDIVSKPDKWPFHNGDPQYGVWNHIHALFYTLLHKIYWTILAF